MHGSLRWKAAGCCDGVQAIVRELTGGNVSADLAIGRRINQEPAKQLP